ncbi:glycosyltransferase [Nonomuraea sp. NPDC047897]|uniref:glycosyltransferase n=1 Tax=Nonomuraea sp. NPDC047897 TaxID=3364346 RepID=UPI003717BFD9
MPILSVIVPFHDVEKYLGPCLDSLAAQSLRDLEVICVDDGSRDGAADLVEARMAADRRVRLIRQDNQGVGNARNTGLRHAGGRYLAFVDGDDTVPPRAFHRLVSSLETTGSDLACGNVMRLHRNLLVPSWAHREAFARPLRRTHITRHPLLVRDRMLWNKVYRRSFWESLGLTFPERMYEDQPVAMRAHVGASSVDVLKGVVYHWRLREERSSITERRLEPGNLRDRLLSVLETSSLLAERAPELKPYFDRDTLDIDLAVAVEAVARMGGAADAELLDLAGSYLDGVAPGELLSLPFTRRLMVRLLHLRRLEELAAVFDRDRDGRLWPHLASDGLLRRRWYARHPAVPPPLAEVTGELALAARLLDIGWRDGLLCGEGWATVGRFAVEGLRRMRVRVWLEERGTGDRLALGDEIVSPAWRSVSQEDGGAVPEHGFAFGFAWDPAALGPARLARQGRWDLWAELRGAGLRLAAKVAGPRWLPPSVPAPVRLAAAEPPFVPAPRRVTDPAALLVPSRDAAPDRPAVGSRRGAAATPRRWRGDAPRAADGGRGEADGGRGEADPPFVPAPRRTPGPGRCDPEQAVATTPGHDAGHDAGLGVPVPGPVRRAGVWVVPVRGGRGVWGLRLRRAEAFVSECRLDGDALLVAGELADLGDGDPVLRLVRRTDGEEMYFPLSLTGHRFRARVPLGEVDAPVGRESRWEVVIDQGRPLRPLVRTPARPAATVAGRRFQVDRSDDGTLMLAER